MLCLGSVRAQDSVDTKIFVNDVKDENTFVIIISNENYKYEESVPFARSDGEVFRIYCQKTLGISESNIRFVADATLNEMNYQFSWLEDALKAYDGTARAIIYYTGHGMPDENSKEAYLLPVDGFSKSPATSALSTKVLYDKLGKMNSKSIMVFLDACFSGAKRDGKMLASSRGVAIKPNSNPVGSNTVVFSAAQGNETAYPYKSMKHGMFTYYLLDKLQQTGGAVTMGDLSDYVTTQVKRKSVVENGKSQTPSVVAVNNDWKSWQLAAKAAKKIETRNVLDVPAQKPVAKSDDRVKKDNQSEQVKALINQGKKQMRAMQYEKARGYFLEAVDSGSVEANYQMGMLYINSNYDGHNRETAKNYFLKAATSSHVEAQYQLGLLYIGRDKDTARKWLRLAAGAGHEEARRRLLSLNK
ncbi:MAG: caspase family protein [Prevotella sp.]|nr:caspase family protein [Prevotella sp.]